MPVTTMKDRASIHDMLRMLKHGPSSLAEDSVFYPKDSATKAARARLYDDYQLWVTTWVIPQLEALLPPPKRSTTLMDSIQVDRAKGS